MSRFLILLISILLMGTCYSQNFTFFHVSDMHVPHSDSLSFIRSLKNSGSVYLSPYDVTAHAPSFVMASGDLTEFGGGWWPQYAAACEETGLKWYHTPGNHDNTWYNLRPDLRKVHGQAYYSFDFQGCHFIVLDSATPQEPLPSFGREQIEWLKKDLVEVQKTTPIFVMFHHPLGGSEFISSYEQERVLELLRPYNVAALLTGHYHRPKLIEYNGFHVVVGGQGYADWAGYNVFCIQDGYLRVAYRKMSEPHALTPVLEKKISSRDAEELVLKNVEVSRDGTRLHGTYELPCRDHFVSAHLCIDDAAPIALKDTSGSFSVNLDLLPGWHFATLLVQHGSQKMYKSFSFENKGAKKWECSLPCAFKSGPTLFGERIYVGGMNGKVYALEKSTGKTVWHFQAGGEILGRVCREDSSIFFASSDGGVYSISTEGSLRWKKEMGSPVYAPVVLAGNRLVACTREGKIAVLSLETGNLVWEKKDATYTIESRPFVSRGNVYFGAWDCHIYGYKLEDGSLISKIKGVGSSTKPGDRYYSPADCPPVVLENRLYATDRAYILGEWNPTTGELFQSWEKISAISLSQDGKSLLLRKTTKELEKMSLTGNVMWSTPEVCDSIPTPAVEFNGKVYVCSAGGKLSSLDSATGKIVWQYQVTPGLRVYGEIAVDTTGIYVADMDGKITALVE